MSFRLFYALMIDEVFVFFLFSCCKFDFLTYVCFDLENTVFFIVYVDET